MDKLRAIKVFVKVAQSDSLSAAARQMGEPLTNVSRLLTQLEADLGCSLIHRTTRQMALTAEGRNYLTVCKLLLDDLEQAELQLTGQATELSGEIVVTAPVAFGRLHVLPVINLFLQQYPKISAKLMLLDRQVDMLDEGIDVALRIGHLPDSAHLATHVGTQSLITCAAPNYLKERGTPLQVQDLPSHDLIMFTGRPSGARWVFKSQAHGQKAIRLQPRLSVNTAEAAIESAVAGLGITRVLAYQAQAQIDAGELIPVLTEFDDTTIPVNLLRWPNRTDPQRVREFINFASKQLRART